MKSKILWFVTGFISALAVLYSVAWYINRPFDASANLPKWQQKMMLKTSPWLQSAKSASFGSFNVLVPSDSKQNSEALFLPKEGSNPHVSLTTNSLELIDNNGNIISISYSPMSGEILSYDLSLFPPTGEIEHHFDNNIDGQFDLKIIGNKISVFNNGQWAPVVFANGGRFIEVDGVMRKIQISNHKWQFIE